MKKSQLRNIIKEIIRQEVPRSAEKASYGSCAPKRDLTTFERMILALSNIFYQVSCLKGKCKYDDDCDGFCYCEHPNR